MNGKIHTLEVNSSIKKKERQTAGSIDYIQGNINESFNQIQQASQSEAIKSFKKQKGFPGVVSKIFQVKVTKRSPKVTSENKHDTTFDPSHYIFADKSFENENNVNVSFDGSNEMVQSPAEESQRQIPPKDTFVIKKTARNKLIISNVNTRVNTLPQSTKQINTQDQGLPLIPMKTKPLSLSTDENTNLSISNLKDSSFQNPQTFRFEEKVKEKLLGPLGADFLSNYPKTTTNASSVIFSKGQNFVFTHNGQKHILKGPLKPLNLNSHTKAFKFSDSTSDENLPNIAATSLEFRSLAQKIELATVLRSKKQSASEVLDLSNSSRRPSSRFKPQEAVLEKLFNLPGSTKDEMRSNYLKNREYLSTQITNYS